MFKLVVELFFDLGELLGGEGCKVDCVRLLAGSRGGERSEVLVWPWPAFDAMIAVEIRGRIPLKLLQL